MICSAEVATALAERRAVVALESTIFSNLGLPAPANAEALERCLTAVRNRNAVPAITAVIDGIARVGLEPEDHERVLTGSEKVAARDLPFAIAQRWPFGATTVSAALTLAARAGINVFATGGIGGVHRGAETSGDISADLGALAAHPLVTVSAGAKAFLDLPRTLEHLETIGVPVVGYGTDELPGFWMRSTGLALRHRVDNAHEAAAIAAAAWDLGYHGGVLVVVPIPEADAVASETIERAIADAEDAAVREGITGHAVTPFVLARVAESTEGRSLPANLSLAEHNAWVAADISVALAEMV
jgi:pseudouridine-5'-phosphate glycosidase